MRTRRRAGWLLLLAVVGVAGCLGPRTGESKSAVDLQAAAQAKTELPPAQAARLCLSAAEELAKNGCEEEAIAKVESARHYDPELPGAARLMGVLCDRLGRYDQAWSEYQQALQGPRSAELFNDVGYHFYQCGDWRQAEDWLRQALALDGGCQRAWVNLGMVLCEQGRYDEGYAAFVKVVGPSAARSNVGVILARHGKHEDARQYFAEALGQQPDLKAAHAFLQVLAKDEGTTAPSDDVQQASFPAEQ